MDPMSVRHLGGDRFAVSVRGHELLVDQPVDAGGEDTAPTPTELLVAALACCVAFYARRYLRRHGHEPKNRYGESLFAVTVRDALRWVSRQQDAEVVALLPRYNPRWTWWLLRVPVLREVLTWNLVIVLRKR